MSVANTNEYIVQPWIYKPLTSTESIRLFELHTAQEYDAPLIGSVTEHDLADLEVTYYALSYVWGDESDQASMFDADDPSRQLSITRNLETALRYLSICINQNDLAEKAHQIPLMCDIYQHAECVFVWLGEETQYADYQGMFDYMCILFNEVKPNLDEYERVRIEQQDEAPSLEEFYPKLDVSSAPAIAFQNFFRDTPWFHRAWTMQESVVAKDKMFLCGAHRLPDPFRLMPSLFELSSRFEALDSGHTKWIKHLMSVPRLLTKMSFNWTKYTPDERPPLSFSQCLAAQQGAGCKDARDVVYSVLGLVQDPEFDRTKILPDYEKPVAVVYAEALAELIRCEGSIHALSSINYHQNTSSDYGLPSWIPDWKNVAEMPILTYSVENTSSHRFEAATCTGSPIVRISQDFRKLQIAGVRVTKIKSIIDKQLRCAYATVKWDEGTDRKSNVTESLQQITGKADAKLLVRKDEQTGKRVFPLDKGDGPQTRNQENIFAHNLLHEILATAGEKAIRYWPKDEEQELIDHATTDQLIGVSLPSVGRLAHTEVEALAIVNEVTLPGDVVVVPFGGQVPIILRPQGDHYVFIGECFVTGFMHEEAVAPLRAELKAKEIVAQRETDEGVSITMDPGNSASTLADEMESLLMAEEKWAQIGKVSESWLPGKDNSTGEWFTIIESTVIPGRSSCHSNGLHQIEEFGD